MQIAYFMDNDLNSTFQKDELTHPITSYLNNSHDTVLQLKKETTNHYWGFFGFLPHFRPSPLKVVVAVEVVVTGEGVSLAPGLLVLSVSGPVVLIGLPVAVGVVISGVVVVLSGVVVVMSTVEVVVMSTVEVVVISGVVVVMSTGEVVVMSTVEVVVVSPVLGWSVVEISSDESSQSEVSGWSKSHQNFPGHLPLFQLSPGKPLSKRCPQRACRGNKIEGMWILSGKKTTKHPFHRYGSSFGLSVVNSSR